MLLISENKFLNPTFFDSIILESINGKNVEIDVSACSHVIPFISSTSLSNIKCLFTDNDINDIKEKVKSELHTREKLSSNLLRYHMRHTTRNYEINDMYGDPVINEFYHCYLNIDKSDIGLTQLMTEDIITGYDVTARPLDFLMVINNLACRMHSVGKEFNLSGMCKNMGFKCRNEKVKDAVFIAREHLLGQMQPIIQNNEVVTKPSMLSNLKSLYDSIIEYNSIAISESYNYMNTQDIESLLENKIIDLFITDPVSDVDVIREWNELIQLKQLIENRCETILEANSKVAKKIISASGKAEEKVRSGMHGVRKVKDDVKAVSHAVKKIPESLINHINSDYKKLKELDTEQRKKYIIEGNRHKSIMRRINLLLRGGIFLTAGGPVYGLLGFMVSVAVDKKRDNKIRKQILDELETEHKIIQEKLSDAKSEGSKEEKYKLMRLEKKLDKDITKIKYSFE